MHSQRDTLSKMKTDQQSNKINQHVLNYYWQGAVEFAGAVGMSVVKAQENVRANCGKNWHHRDRAKSNDRL